MPINARSPVTSPPPSWSLWSFSTRKLGSGTGRGLDFQFMLVPTQSKTRWLQGMEDPPPGTMGPQTLTCCIFFFSFYIILLNKGNEDVKV